MYYPSGSELNLNLEYIVAELLKQLRVIQDLFFLRFTLNSFKSPAELLQKSDKEDDEATIVCAVQDPGGCI